MIRLIAAAVIAVALAPAARAGYLLATVSLAGSANGSLALLTDMNIPAETTFWQDPQNVWWTGVTTATFTFDLGSVKAVSDLIVSVDNNDQYIFTYSTDGVTFSALTQILPGDGEIPVGPGGMDTMSTFAASGEYVANFDFAQVNARYIRVVGGINSDQLYSIGEVQIYGPDVNPVPEPASLTLLGIGAVGFFGYGLRRRKAVD